MSEPNQTECKASIASEASAPEADSSLRVDIDLVPSSAVPPVPVPPVLERAELAYENPAFLNSADGRVIRILAEYTEPLARFRRERIQDTVVFFGSARFHGRE